LQNTYKESPKITLKDIDSLRKGTRPEKLVRRVLTNLGYSYRLNKYNLPGRPDIVLENLKKIIFEKKNIDFKNPVFQKWRVFTRHLFYIKYNIYIYIIIM